jgi:hypothetical protein
MNEDSPSPSSNCDARGDGNPDTVAHDLASLGRASTARLLALARVADRELDRMGALNNGEGLVAHPVRSRLELLLAIYAIVNRRLARAPLDPQTFLPVVKGISWDAASPAAGDIADVPPFGNAQRWAALALGLRRPAA